MRLRGKGPRKAPQQYTVELVCNVYDAFLREKEETKIASALGTTFKTLQDWMEKYPDLKKARDLAISRRVTENTLAGYIYKHLTPEAQKVWDEIEFWDEDGSATTRIAEILSGRPTKLRQEIFIHALISKSFNLSEACRIACVSRQTVESWRKTDLQFAQLVEEIQFHKKNFFESSLIDLVAAGNPGAVMFVNRTVNSDRGYGEKMQVNHDVDVSFQIEDLGLDRDTKRKILDAMRAKRLNEPGQVIDVPAPALPEHVPSET